MSSHAAVVNVLTENQSLWAATPGIVKVVNQLTTRMGNINALELTRNGGTKGATQAKQDARDAMVADTLVVAGAVSAYADDIGDSELLAKVEYTPTAYDSARDTEVSNLCQGIHDTAAGIVDKLADNKVTADTLKAQQDKIDAYGKLVGKPRATRSNGKAARGVQQGEFAGIDRLLSKQLDGLMTPFKASQPEFFAAYFAARNIVDNPGGHKGKNGNGNGNGNGTPPKPS